MITIDNTTKEEVKPKVVFTNEVSLGKIGTLKITQNLQKLIDYLHFKVGATEWSGILFYKLTKGNIKDLKNLEFTADFVYPMNIGSHTYTEFEYTGDVVDSYDIYGEGIEMSTGLIHSHNNFAAFFSGTDSQELKDNASSYNYYVSLIVNFSHTYCAKVAFPSKTEVVSKFSVRDELGKFFNRSSKKEENTILIGDLDIIIENEVEKPEWIEERIKVLEDKKRIASVVTTGFNNQDVFTEKYPQYNRTSRVYDDFDFPNTVSNFKKDWKSQSEVKGIDYRNKSSQFLSALINLDPNITNSNIADVITDLNKLTESELEIFEEAMDINLEIIHTHIYGTGSDKELKHHCTEAKLELYKLEALFGDTPVFNIIFETICAYEL